MSNCIVEEERRIPLHQHSIVELDTNPVTSSFASKTIREIFPQAKQTLSHTSPTKLRNKGDATKETESPPYQTCKQPKKNAPFNSSVPRSDLMINESEPSIQRYFSFEMMHQKPRQPPKRPIKSTLNSCKKGRKTESSASLKSEESMQRAKPIIQLIAEERGKISSPGPGSYTIDIQ